MSKLEIQIRHLNQYLKWRYSVLFRDYEQCKRCGSSNDLEVHHIIAFETILKEQAVRCIEDALSCKLLWDISNGITLCKTCHDLINLNERSLTKMGSSLILPLHKQMLLDLGWERGDKLIVSMTDHEIKVKKKA